MSKKHPLSKAERNRIYYLEHKQEFIERSRERRSRGLDQKNPLTERKSSIKRKYGIEWEEFEIAYNNAKGLCEICSKSLEIWTTKGDGKESASVDHCHTTGKVRGILCRHCNVALGHFKDSRLHLLKAVEYLDTHDVDE